MSGLGVGAKGVGGLADYLEQPFRRLLHDRLGAEAMSAEVDDRSTFRRRITMSAIL